MKYLRQLLMILIFSFIGEVLHAVIPIQMPASIYGLVLLFIALMTGLVKLPQVHEAARFLIEIMPLMFIPAAVGLLESWPVLKPMCGPIVAITVLSTVTVMAAAGLSTQHVIRRARKKAGAARTVPEAASIISKKKTEGKEGEAHA